MGVFNDSISIVFVPTNEGKQEKVMFTLRKENEEYGFFFMNLMYLYTTGLLRGKDKELRDMPGVVTDFDNIAGIWCNISEKDKVPKPFIKQERMRILRSQIGSLYRHVDVGMEEVFEGQRNVNRMLAEFYASVEERGRTTLRTNFLLKAISGNFVERMGYTEESVRDLIEQYRAIVAEQQRINGLFEGEALINLDKKQLDLHVDLLDYEKYLPKLRAHIGDHADVLSLLKMASDIETVFFDLGEFETPAWFEDKIKEHGYDDAWARRQIRNRNEVVSHIGLLFFDEVDAELHKIVKTGEEYTEAEVGGVKVRFKNFEYAADEAVVREKFEGFVNKRGKLVDKPLEEVNIPEVDLKEIKKKREVSAFEEKLVSSRSVQVIKEEARRIWAEHKQPKQYIDEMTEIVTRYCAMPNLGFERKMFLLHKKYGVRLQDELKPEFVLEDIALCEASKLMRDGAEASVKRRNPFIQIYQYHPFDIEKKKGIPGKRKSWAIDYLGRQPWKKANVRFREREDVLKGIVFDTLDVAKNCMPELHPKKLRNIAEHLGIDFEKDISYADINYLFLLNLLGDQEAGKQLDFYNAKDIVVLYLIYQKLMEQGYTEPIFKLSFSFNLDPHYMLHSCGAIDELWQRKQFERHRTITEIGYEKMQRLEMMKRLYAKVVREREKPLEKKGRGIHKEVVVAYVPRGYYLRSFLEANFGEQFECMDPTKDQVEQLVYARYFNELLKRVEYDFFVWSQPRQLQFECLQQRNIDERVFADYCDSRDFGDVHYAYQRKKRAVVRAADVFFECLKKWLDAEDESTQGYRNLKSLYHRGSSVSAISGWDGQQRLIELENPRVKVLTGIHMPALEEEYEAFSEKMAAYEKFVGEVRLPQPKKMSKENFLFLFSARKYRKFLARKFKALYEWHPKKFGNAMDNAYANLIDFLRKNECRIIDQKGDRVFFLGEPEIIIKCRELVYIQTLEEYTVGMEQKNLF